MKSYAQHQEDVLLQECFRDRVNGYYIDVGAWHPVRDSVTCHFYRMGWTGINIEPNATYSDLLRQARPRDITLNTAISNYVGRATLLKFNWSGLSTLTPKYLSHLQAKGCHVVGESDVQVTTLARVFEEYATSEVSFLKVDVEGLEKEVLLGGNWDVFRPCVVVIEATIPLTTDPSWLDWEFILFKHRYCFGCFDGLNRYYVREESSDLLSRLRWPLPAAGEV